MLRSFLGCLFFLLLSSSAFSANDIFSQFIDPEDGQLDASDWLLKKKGFLPVPILITEPAIGYGGGVALVYLSESIGDESKKTGETRQRFAPPAISAIALGGTDNGTWFAGGYLSRSFHKDSLRYGGILGTADVNMDYYGSGNNLPRPISFNTKALFLRQDLKLRLFDSNFFTGLRYLYSDTDNEFDIASAIGIPGIPSIQFQSKSAALALLLDYDSLDNTLTPGKGVYGQLILSRYDEKVGSDSNFNLYEGTLQGFLPFKENRFILGSNLGAKSLSGKAPFYSYPFISMRGIKAMQYQGSDIVQLELELRWNLTPRWSLVGFSGVGQVFGDETDEESVVAWGGGFRYKVAKKLGLYTGVDIATGPDDTAIYIQFGHAWSFR